MPKETVSAPVIAVNAFTGSSWESSLAPEHFEHDGRNWWYRVLNTFMTNPHAQRVVESMMLMDTDRNAYLVAFADLLGRSDTKGEGDDQAAADLSAMAMMLLRENGAEEIEGGTYSTHARAIAGFRWWREKRTAVR